MNNPKSRSSLIGIAGGYLIYLAYELFTGRNAPEVTMAPALSILFAALFALAGLGLFVYAIKLWKTPEEKQEDKQDSGALK